MRELNTALDEHKLVYVFVDRDVMCENRIYQKNVGKDITPGIVSDVRIHNALVDNSRFLSLNVRKKLSIS